MLGFLTLQKPVFYALLSLIVQVVVDFVYTGILALTIENVEEVLSAATHLQAGVAVELCSKYLEMAISVENCVDILNLAELYSLSSMSTRARQFILENFEVSPSLQVVWEWLEMVLGSLRFTLFDAVFLNFNLGFQFSEGAGYIVILPCSKHYTTQASGKLYISHKYFWIIVEILNALLKFIQIY